MHACLRQRVCFGGTAVELEYSGGSAARIGELLFDGVASEQQVLPRARLRLSEVSSGVFEASVDGARAAALDSAGAAARFFLDLAITSLAATCTRGLAFHAAAVSWCGRGVLLPGRSGAGKTTLAGYLATRGFGYLSDELSFVPRGRTALQALRRPLKLRAEGFRALESHLVRPPGHELMQTVEGDTLVAPAPSDPAPPEGVPLAAVVFPRYTAGTDLRFERMSAAQTGLGLMECLLNARNLSGHGFGEVTRVARAVDGYVLHYGRFEQLDTHLGLLTDVASSPSTRTR